MADEITYEYKTVQTVRGTDGLLISKMQKDGWELVDQAQGRLRSTLNFRRPKKPLPWLQIGIAGAVLVILSAAIGIGVVFGDGDEAADASRKPPAAANDKPSATRPPTAEGSAAAEPITIKNNPEFAALLKTPDTCDDVNLHFATKYKGRTVAFDGSIVDMERYSAGYDLLLGPGDEGPGTTVGPDFKYENINLSELQLTGENSSARIAEGDRFRFVAKIVEFSTVQCLFRLAPVSTEPR